MKKLILMAGLVVVGIACGETVGGMMQDAGAMLADAGDMMQPDAGAQTAAQCNQTHSVAREDGSRTEHRYAVVTVNTPRNVAVERCYAGGANPNLPASVRCSSSRFTYFEGNDIYIQCGSSYFDADGQPAGDNPDPTSITVYE